MTFNSYLADRLNLIQPSPSISAMSKAKAMIARGLPVCNMAAGEPDFATPPHIVEAAYVALKNGETRYTAVDGTLALKEAIASKFRRENGLQYSVDCISVGAGAKQVLFNILAASVNEGDEVIVPAPYWVSYPDIVKLHGGIPVHLTTNAQSAFKISPAQLEAAITNRTKWLILNSPNNPSGAVYSSQELAALGQVLRRFTHVMVLTDDIYEHLIYDGASYTSFAQANPDLMARTVTVNGVSKAYAMTGWRIGYAGGPLTLIKAMEKLQSQTSGNPAAVSQAAAVAALNGPSDFIVQWRTEFQERRDLVVSMLDGKAGLRCPTPAGAFYAYVGCDQLIGRHTPAGKTIATDSDLVMYLLDDFNVATVQGAAYGVSPAFRVSFAVDKRTITEACSRIVAACEALR